MSNEQERKSLEDQISEDDGIVDVLEDALNFYCESRVIDPIEYTWTLDIEMRKQDEIDDIRANE